MCENGGRAVYSQLRLHVTGECNRHQAGINYQTTERVARHPVYTKRISFVLAHALPKVKNFEHVTSKTQCEHTTGVGSENADMQRVKTPVKTLLMRFSWKNDF